MTPEELKKVIAKAKEDLEPLKGFRYVGEWSRLWFGKVADSDRKRILKSHNALNVTCHEAAHLLAHVYFRVPAFAYLLTVDGKLYGKTTAYHRATPEIERVCALAGPAQQMLIRPHIGFNRVFEIPINFRGPSFEDFRSVYCELLEHYSKDITKVNKEVSDLLNRARDIILNHWKGHVRIGEALLERKELSFKDAVELSGIPVLEDVLNEARRLESDPRVIEKIKEMRSTDERELRRLVGFDSAPVSAPDSEPQPKT